MEVVGSQEYLKEFQQFSCHHNDQECQQLLCPQGMEWSEHVQQCLVPDGWKCCLNLYDQTICFYPQKIDEESNQCSNPFKMAGLAPFVKQF
jgi:hypothetical protein